MSGVVPLQFRPTIIIFVGPEEKLTTPGAPGDSVLAHLTDICAGLELAQRRGLGLIAVREGERQARPLSLQASDDGALSIPGNMPTQPADFPDLFEDMLTSVMDARLHKWIEGAGFPIPDSHAQIFIVAHTSSTWVSRIAAWVGETLAGERIATNITYLLIDVPRYLGEVATPPSSNGHAPGGAAPAVGPDIWSGGDALPPDEPDGFYFPPAQLSFTGPDPTNVPLPGDSPERRLPPSWAYDLTSRGGALPLVNACYVYQRLAQDERYYKESDVRFGVAEALFTLVATSVSAAESFREVMRLGPTIQLADADTRIGTFATSLIRFPRAEVERFCSDMLGADIMREWHEATLRRNVNESEREQQSAAAQRLGQHILDGVRDSEPRPGTEEATDEHLWPTLAFVRNREALLDLRKATQDLFENFQLSAVEEFVTDEESWSAAAEQLEGRAARLLPTWKQAVEEVWGEARSQLEAEVDQTVLRLWLTDESGTALAQEYIKRLNLALDRLDKYFVRWRGQHEDDYRLRLGRLRRWSEEGPWYTPLDESQVVGPRGAEPVTQAVPSYIPPAGVTMPPLSADFPPDESDTGISASAGVSPQQSPPVAVDTLDRMDPAAQISNAYLPDEERQVAARLSERARHLRTQIPAVWNLIAVCTVADPALILLALTLVPARWSHQPLLVAAIALVVIGMTAWAGWLVRSRALTAYDEAQHDMLEIRRLYYARQCQLWEDQLRAVLRGRLSRNVRRMQDRLANIDAFIQRIQAELIANARRTQDALFNGPSGLRDVFVANGRQLSPFDYTLDDLYAEVRRRMRASSGDQRTDSPRTMIARLREALVRDSVNLLRMEDQDIEARVRQFVQASVARQLVGDLVSVSYALQASGDAGKRIWQASLRSAVIQYRPLTSAPILTYIGARDDQRATIPSNAIPPATTMARTSHQEWLATMRFWTGGARSQWNILATDDSPLGQRLTSKPSWNHSQVRGGHSNREAYP